MTRVEKCRRCGAEGVDTPDAVHLDNRGTCRECGRKRLMSWIGPRPFPKGEREREHFLEK